MNITKVGIKRHKHIVYEHNITTPIKLQTLQQRNFEVMSENYCAVGSWGQKQITKLHNWQFRTPDRFEV